MTKQRSESDSAAVAVAPPPPAVRVPICGDTVHLVSVSHPKPWTHEYVATSEPARVVRVATAGDPATLLDLELSWDVVHPGCPPVKESLATDPELARGCWTSEDEAGGGGPRHPQGPDRIPAVGAVVFLFEYTPVVLTEGGWKGGPADWRAGRVVRVDGDMLDIAIRETEIQRNVPAAAAEQPSERTWAWSPIPHSPEKENAR